MSVFDQEDTLDLRVLTEDGLKLRVDDPENPDGKVITIKMPTLLQIMQCLDLSKDMQTAEKQLTNLNPLEIPEKLKGRFYQIFPDLKEYDLGNAQMEAVLLRTCEKIIPTQQQLLAQYGVSIDGGDDAEKKA